MYRHSKGIGVKDIQTSDMYAMLTLFGDTYSKTNLEYKQEGSANITNL